MRKKKEKKVLSNNYKKVFRLGSQVQINLTACKFTTSVNLKNNNNPKPHTHKPVPPPLDCINKCVANKKIKTHLPPIWLQLELCLK